MTEPRRRKRRPAPATRIAATGVATAATLGLVAGMTAAEVPDPAADVAPVSVPVEQPPVQLSSPVEPTRKVVVVVRRHIQPGTATASAPRSGTPPTGSAPTASAPRPAPRSAPAPRPRTRSGGS